ncbi:MOSC domain-containing protein [Anaerolineales bacterium]
MINLLSREALLKAFEALAASDKDQGHVEMIVCRPNHGERIRLEKAELDPVQGLIGDNWQARGSRHTEDGQAHPDMQLTLMNSKIIDIVSGDISNWMWAGDQLYVDFDLSLENLPIGQRLQIGEAILEVSAPPHTGCKKFAERYGTEALKIINSAEGKAKRWRGMNTRIIQGGLIKTGDKIQKL